MPSPIGNSIDAFLQTYLGVKDRNRNIERQRRLDARQDEIDALNQKQIQSSLENAALQRVLTQNQIDALPKKQALSDLDNILKVQGDEAYNNPAAVEAASKAGIPFQTKQLPLESRPFGVIDNALKFGQMNTKEKMGREMGVAPRTEVVLPEAVRVRGAQNRATEAQANFTANLFNGGQLKDTPENRIAVSMIPGTTANEVFGAPSAAAGAPQNGMGEDALQGLDEQTKNIVKKIANYEFPIPSASALRSPQWIEWIKRAAAYDPSFDATQYGVRQKLRLGFTSGKEAANIRSLNTVIGHLGTLKSKVDALNNSDYPAYNTVANYLVRQKGDPRITEFESAANAVESEAAQLFKGMGATDQEIKAWRHTLNPNMSQEQLNGSIHTMLGLLNSRLHALDTQYQSGMGKPRSFSILSPEARKNLQALGVNATDWDTVMDKNPVDEIPGVPAMPNLGALNVGPEALGAAMAPGFKESLGGPSDAEIKAFLASPFGKGFTYEQAKRELSK